MSDAANIQRRLDRQAEQNKTADSYGQEYFAAEQARKQAAQQRERGNAASAAEWDHIAAQHSARASVHLMSPQQLRYHADNELASRASEAFSRGDRAAGQQAIDKMIELRTQR